MGWNGGKIRNRGRFGEQAEDKVSVAKQQNQAPEAPNSLALKRKWNPPVRAAWLFGFGVLAILACGGIGWPVVKSMVADLADIIFGAVFIAIVCVAHGFTSWWCVKARPGIAPVLIVQAPFPALYVMTWVWFKVGFAETEGGPPSLWYLPWAAVASIALSWLITWRLANRPEPKSTKLFAAGLALWLVINGGGFALDRWNATNGFGMKGYPTPGEALNAFTATSCVFNLDWYTHGGKKRKADCAKYLSHTENGPDRGFDQVISTEQPRQALEHWWAAFRQFRELQPLELQPGLTFSENAGVSTATFTVSSPHWQVVNLAEYHCFPQGREERWTVHFEKAAFGGWKVSRLDIDRAVTVVPFIGSPCDRTKG